MGDGVGDGTGDGVDDGVGNGVDNGVDDSVGDGIGVAVGEYSVESPCNPALTAWAMIAPVDSSARPILSLDMIPTMTSMVTRRTKNWRGLFIHQPLVVDRALSPSPVDSSALVTLESWN